MKKKHINDYSYEELSILSPEQLIALMQEQSDEMENKADNFWKKEYKKFSFEQKVDYWAGELNRQMRWQAESGLDEYAIFTPSWYKNIKSKESSFDKIMDKVFDKYLSWEWDKASYLKRIK